MDNTNNTETQEITNHNSCIADSKVFGTVKLCKINNGNPSDICLANFCISCGENLGENNPRQYCNKIYCPYED